MPITAKQKPQLQNAISFLTVGTTLPPELKCYSLISALPLNSVFCLLCLVHGDRNSAVRVQHHLSTAEYGHQQEKTEQEEEEHSKTKVHIHIKSAFWDAGRVHIHQKFYFLKKISSSLFPYFCTLITRSLFSEFSRFFMSLDSSFLLIDTCCRPSNDKMDWRTLWFGTSVLHQ